jgi:regulator of sirC expression with transglutaminase-like and TPR domain
MDATDGAAQRFAAAVAAPPADVRLDVAAFCIAAHAHPGLDVDDWCRRLDDLAAGCRAPTFDALRAHLFEGEGFVGNRADYADPENSFLDSVVVRRTGIPITLSLLMMEAGRRIGVEVRGVGMPGHFIVQDGERDDVWCDPFHGGARYDAAGCRRLFAQVHGPTTPFRPEYLAPSSSHQILARMLANLEHGRLAEEPDALEWMCDLHLALPDLDAGERARLGSARRAVRARWN